MELNISYFLTLNEFISDADYTEIYVDFDGANLLLYPQNPLNVAVRNHDVLECDDADFSCNNAEFTFDDEHPFSIELFYQDFKWVIVKDDDIYPIINAILKHRGLLDDDYDEDIIIDNNKELPCFWDCFIEFKTAYEDYEYVIKSVQVED